MKIEVFALKNMPIESSEKVALCIMDSIDEIEEGARPYISDEKAMSSYMQKHEKLLMDAFSCQFRAQSLGLKKLPAIVFDDKAVVYGALSVTQAKALLSQHKEAL